MLKPTRSQWLQDATATLRHSGSSTPRLDAQLLLEHVTGLDRTSLLAQDAQSLTGVQNRQASQLLGRRAKGEPLVYLTGHKEFYGIELLVNPAVMIPRPETETLVETALSRLAPAARVLELGTGSGAIAIAVATQRPDIIITAVDSSAAALAVAKQNVDRHRAQVSLLQSDLFSQVPGRYNAVLANLPYGVPKQWQGKPGLAFEPSKALYSDNHDGLDVYRRVLVELNQHLAPTGWALFEHEPAQRPELDRLARQAGFITETVSEFVTAFRSAS